MSSTKYAPVERWPTEKSEYYADSLEDEPELSTPVNPYVSRPAWTYLQYLIPLFAVFFLPLTFAGYVDIKGPVPAPQRLASFAKSSPKLTAQIVAILATSLTATTRWALGGAAALLARKRFLLPRPVYELDMFFSLRNISVIWDWRHRKRMMFLTWFLVAVCGLLTSGFFTLLNPLAMEVQIRHPPAQEINFITDLDLNYWEWPSGRRFGSMGTVNGSTTLSDIPALLRSISRQYAASKNRSIVYPRGSFVTTFTELGYASFMGSTSGVLVFGGENSDTLLPEGRPKKPSYTLDLQGSWIDVTCSISGTPPLNVTFDRNMSDVTLGVNVRYSFTCPGSSITEEGEVGVGLGALLAIDCPIKRGTTAIFFSDLSDPLESPLNRMSCNASPQMGDVEVTLHPDIQAFQVTKKNYSALSLSPFARNLTSSTLKSVVDLFRHVPVIYHAEEVSLAHQVDETNYDGAIVEIMEMILSALYEFEASWKRSLITQYRADPLSEIPPAAKREVKVVLNERTIGWEVKQLTWVGLAPVAVVCAIAFAMIAMALMAENKLTLFDPMSPVSLLAATSVGEVVFSKGNTIGDPLDENVLVTRISYANRGQTWGLWTSKVDSRGAIRG